MKRLIQKSLEPFGYTFRRISTLKPFVPFVRELHFPEASFKIWISNQDASMWYDQKILNSYAEQRAFVKMTQPGDRVLEIGSHHGYTGMLLSRLVGDAGYVVGIEPFPANRMVEDAQLTLNPEIKNLKFIHAACTDYVGKVKIQPIHNSCISNAKSADTIEVPAVTGDFLDEQLGPFNFIKIDVEGFEVDVLKGCKKILSRLPRLNLEIHLDLLPERGFSVDDVFDLIDVAKYRGHMIIRPGEHDKIVPFDISAIKTLNKDPKHAFNCVNVYLDAVN